MAMHKVGTHCYQRQESELFFNMERILRWMRWFNRGNDPHPELTAYENSLRRERHHSETPGLLEKTFRLLA